MRRSHLSARRVDLPGVKRSLGCLIDLGWAKNVALAWCHLSWWDRALLLLLGITFAL